MSSIELRQGDCRDVLKGIPDCSIDACVTDPPYSLVSIQKRFGKPGSAPAKHGTDGVYQRASAGFMGQQWDTGEVVHDVKFWAEVYRALKPGGHMVAFSATRTYHRMGCAIEDAGFEIRDMVAWLYASGFPKGHNVAIDYEKRLCDRVVGDDGRSAWLYRSDGAPMATQPPFRDDDANVWAGWDVALKPALEPVVLARKGLIGTVAENVLAHGTGAMNIDAARVGDGERQTQTGGMGRKANPVYGEFAQTETEAITTTLGRWPANVVHDGSDEVLTAFAQFGESKSSDRIRVNVATTQFGFGDGKPEGRLSRGHSDSGTAARFYFNAKAGKEDRWGSRHPTVKPVTLMRWLVRLLCPPGGTVLDPFAGSGTTGVAALAEARNCILIEREDQFAADIRARLAFYQGEGRHSMVERNRHKPAGVGALRDGGRLTEDAAKRSTLPLFGAEKPEIENTAPEGVASPAA